MQLEIGKRYRCRNGCTIKVNGIRLDGVAECYVDNGQDRPMTFNALTGVPIGYDLQSYNVIGLVGPELMFSFKRPAPYHSVTVSETKLNHVIACAQRGPLYCMEDQQLLAFAAERMIELTKIKPPSHPLPQHIIKEIDRMCSSEPKRDPKRDVEHAAADLAKMLKDDLGVVVTPILLRLWLNERWAEVAKLAHKIHGSA